MLRSLSALCAMLLEIELFLDSLFVLRRVVVGILANTALES